MKAPKNLFLFMATLCLTLFFLNCKGPRNSPKTTTVPFKADFIGNYTHAGPDTFPNPKCVGALSFWRAIVDGNGTGTPLGNFTVHFDFCGDSLSNYGNAYAYMVGADCDTLFVSCAGRVIEGRMDSHPSYVISYWKDPFKISGGTGKFKGATGEGTTNDYNSSEDPNSHHSWTGTITMVKGEK